MSEIMVSLELISPNPWQTREDGRTPSAGKTLAEVFEEAGNG